MALIKCKECGSDVSTQAKTCPKCGAKVVDPNAVKNGLIGCSGLIVVGLIIVLAVKTCGGGSGPDVTGGQPVLVTYTRTAIAHHGRFAVTPEALKHPDQLKAYFHWQCSTEARKQFCGYLLWLTAEDVPRHPFPLTDQEVDRQVGSYDFNATNGYEQLIIRGKEY